MTDANDHGNDARTGHSHIWELERAVCDEAIELLQTSGVFARLCTLIRERLINDPDVRRDPRLPVGETMAMALLASRIGEHLYPDHAARGVLLHGLQWYNQCREASDPSTGSVMEAIREKLQAMGLDNVKLIPLTPETLSAITNVKEGSPDELKLPYPLVKGGNA